MNGLKQWWAVKREAPLRFLSTEKLTEDEQTGLRVLEHHAMMAGYGNPYVWGEKDPAVLQALESTSLAICAELEKLSDAMKEAADRG